MYPLRGRLSRARCTRRGLGCAVVVRFSGLDMGGRGNCSIRSVTRRRHAVVGRLMLPNPRWVDIPHVVSPQARVERRADLRNKLVRMIEVVPADADDVPTLGLEVALALALAGK